MNQVDPLKLAKLLWPDVYFYKQQRQIIKSVWHNDETYVPAGNMLGKDFVAAFIVLAFFLTRHPCRVVTTSAKEDHLRVLWGEMGRFIRTAAKPITANKGGPLVVFHREIRKVVKGEVDPLSYVKGMVASDDSAASMQGHHIANTGDGIPRTLFVADECSSVPDMYYKMAITWANRVLAIGNTWPCENFFKRAIKGEPGTDDRGGDIKAPNNGRYYRKVIQIKASDSPNVRLAVKELSLGKEPSNRILIPGVKPYEEYQRNLAMWDDIQKSVSLNAEFYEGADVLLYPPEWLELSEQFAQSNPARQAEYMGVDSAMGGDHTAWVIIGPEGMVELISEKTPNTAVIPRRTIELITRYHLPPRNVHFDHGGGGYQHVCTLRDMGYEVESVAFGESVAQEIHSGITIVPERKAHREEHYVYKNRRAQMYGMLRDLIDPFGPRSGNFGLPSRLLDKPRKDGTSTLRQQLAPIPLWYDGEGRLFLPPKQRRPDLKVSSEQTTMNSLIGCSPDEADALVLAVYGMCKRDVTPTAGTF